MKTTSLKLLLPFLVVSHVFAGIDLDFGDGYTNADFPVTSSTLDYGYVGNDGLGTDIYARITALNSFSGNSSGATGGDARINLFANQTAKLRLSLFQDAGYAQAYAPDPVQDYSWTTTFADIEGTDGNANIYESITLRSQGIFEVAKDTALVITDEGETTTFSGVNAKVYTNPTSDTLTALQGQVAVAFTVSNVSWFDFDYSAVGLGRNLFVDVGNLTFSTPTDTFEVGEYVVPEPASLVMFLLGISGSAAACLIRRKRS